MEAAAREWSKIEGGDWLSYLGLRGSKHHEPLLHFRPKSPVKYKSPVRHKSPRKSPRSPVKTTVYKPLQLTSAHTGIHTPLKLTSAHTGIYTPLKLTSEHTGIQTPKWVDPYPRKQGVYNITNYPFMQHHIDMLDQTRSSPLSVRAVPLQRNMQEYMDEHYPSPRLPLSPFSGRSSYLSNQSPSPLSGRSSFVPLPNQSLPRSPLSGRSSYVPSLPSSPSGNSYVPSLPSSPSGSPYVPLPDMSPTIIQSEEAMRNFQQGLRTLETRNRSRSPRVHHA